MSATAQRNGRGSRVPLITASTLPQPEIPAPAAATPNLDAAVLRVQAKARPLVRNAQGQVQSRTYSYVTLGAVVDEVLPLLVEEELVWKTFPTVLDTGAAGLRYRMVHVPSGESDEDTMPLPCDATMQGLGSGITYGRRYAITAYLNLTVDEDDDGASANRPAAAGSASPPARPAAGSQPQARPARGGERPATAKQRDMLRKKAAAAKLTDSVFADAILIATGNEPRHMGEEQAARWLKMGLERLPGQNVDAVIAAIAAAAAEGGAS